MKLFRHMVIGVFAMGIASVGALAEEKINSKESLRICKDAMAAEIPEGTEFKFRRRTATSVEPDRYKHWINFVEKNGREKTVKKLRCETSRVGEVLVMEIKPGSWKI